MATKVFDMITQHLTTDQQRYPDRYGIYHADCPLCGKPAKPGQNHFTLSPNKTSTGHNYRCYVCGEGGSLSQLAEKMGIATKEQPTDRKETIYPYYDEQGTLLYEAVRYEPGKNGAKKGFYQRLPDGSPKLGNVRRVLYRTPEVLAAIQAGQDIYIVEGEKDADKLWSLGIAATCNVGGAGKWRDKYSEALQGARSIVILPDNDKPGAKHAEDVAQSLASAGLAARIVELPDIPPKGDVSDWLNIGGDIEQLQELAAAAPLCEPEPEPEKKKPKDLLCTHPDTDQPLYLPDGYFINGQSIWCSTQRGVKQFYTGKIFVRAIGNNLHTGEESATITWNGVGAHKEVGIPRSDLASKNGVAKILGGMGAAVHAGNAQEMSIYLTEFIQRNYQTLPHHDYVERLGVVKDGLLLPAGNINLSNTSYSGRAIKVGNDFDAYKHAIREIATWDNVNALWLVFALGLAGPALGRIQPNRNPVVYLGGRSGAGKTTLANFTLGAYGEPRRMSLQCGSGTTTRIGMQQALLRYNGIPVFFEDVHMMVNRKRGDAVTDLIYDFANRQLRTYGTIDQKGGGGEEVGGTLLMAAEMLPELTHGGQQKRVFTLDCTQNPPLGEPPRSAEGERRAKILEQAVAKGAGTIGYLVCKRIWDNWEWFTNHIQQLEQDRSLHNIQAWGRLLAVAATTLKVAWAIAGVDTLDHIHIMRQWAALYEAGQTQSDPANDAFDRIIIMLAQSEITIQDTWYYLSYDRKIVAAKRSHDQYWRVMTTTPQFLGTIGKGVVEQFGGTWLEKGFLQPHNSERNKISKRVSIGRGQAQCILIPEKVLFVPNTEE
jgi:hypothetical protein